MPKPSISILKTMLFCLALVASAPLANAQEEFSIPSESLQDTREIIVHLPKNYDPNHEEGYPVIYMLDAGSTDKLTAEIAGYYNWGYSMPELIVIGLKNVSRGLDFLPHYYDTEINGEQVYGNGGKLLAYIENELIPFAKDQFNTNGDNVFVGHSWGGQFTTYALSQSPGLFDAYFITSPAFGREGEWRTKTLDTLEKALKQDQAFPDFVYLSVGGDEEPVMLSSYHHLTALLTQHLPEGVKLYHEVHDSAGLTNNSISHTSSAALSIAKAMQLYFPASPEVE
ncbi:alpha/beta hydrolase [Litorimonas sp.]|uniref:alpha/beta hydrolase n=1 Tax=Litorimonas sp. TaxID=1892381 RepID=UPI003A86FC7A